METKTKNEELIKNIPTVEILVSVDKVAPIQVKGPVVIKTSDGKEYQIQDKCFICCCGKSQNKPFCDGSHEGNGKEPSENFF
ncbi:MAG: CDGSH iron-sulfur domain-containing protein [Tannerellaceae bacterium]